MKRAKNRNLVLYKVQSQYQQLSLIFSIAQLYMSLKSTLGRYHQRAHCMVNALLRGETHVAVHCTFIHLATK